MLFDNFNVAYIFNDNTDINIYDDDNNDENNIDNDTLRNNDDNDDDENDIYCFSCTETMALDCVR